MCPSMAEDRVEAPVRPSFPQAWMALPIAGVALGQRFVLPGASIADVMLAVFTALGLVHLARAAPGARLLSWPPLPPWSKWLLALWLWALAGGAVHILGETEPFSAVEFWKSLAKLSFYAVSGVVLALALRDTPRDLAARLVLTAFGVAGAAAIILYVAMLMGAPVPSQLLWGRGPIAAYFSDLWWFGGPHEARRVFLRAQGLASEPSRLGYLQCMALAYVLLRPGARVRVGLRLALMVVSVLLTFSLTAYALLLPIVVLAGATHWPARRVQRTRRGLAIAAIAVVFLALLAPTIYQTVIVRAMRSFSGSGDASSFLRVLGNWKMTYYLLETSPVAGVGLGNFDVVAWDLRAFLFDGYLIQRETQGWNVFAYVLATLGVPGLLILLAMLLSAFRGRGRLAVPFVLGMFADGTFLGAAYWLFLALYTTEGEG
jgi:O-antigen ligase